MSSIPSVALLESFGVPDWVCAEEGDMLIFMCIFGRI